VDSDVHIRLLDDVEHLQGCETLQQIVWSIDAREVVPVSQLRAAQHAGGLVAGAFYGGALAGFVYGFPARPETAADGWGLHSHMLGVAPQHQGRGIGQALKWFQRDWCLEQGFAWMAWTFDPLQAPNANLNLEHLGATGVKYYRDFYGRLGGNLAGDVATDRLLALWRLNAPGVLERRGGSPPPIPEDLETATALGAHGGEPAEPNVDSEAPRVTIAAPRGSRELLTADPARARRWREAHRNAFGAYLARGYVATRFADGHYHLELRTGRQSNRLA
jgi:predicted GNAT superfamily acetyltransferase